MQLSLTGVELRVHTDTTIEWNRVFGKERKKERENGNQQEQVQYNCPYLQRTPQHCSPRIPRLQASPVSPHHSFSLIFGSDLGCLVMACVYT